MPSDDAPHLRALTNALLRNGFTEGARYYAHRATWTTATRLRTTQTTAPDDSALHTVTALLVAAGWIPHRVIDSANRTTIILRYELEQAPKH